MQNIDPVYFLEPLVTLFFSLCIVVYWHYRRRFTRTVAVFTLLAYAGAIALKIIVQDTTYPVFLARFSGNLVAFGLYFGAQTVFFEVGGAFLVATWAVRRGKLRAEDAEGYGLGLGFWENAGYIGILGLVNLITIYLMIASGGSRSQTYTTLVSTRPDLFYPSTQALLLIAYGLLERVTSLLFHFSFGYLCLIAALTHRKQYLVLALPMGLVDFFVPFAGSLGIDLFEAFLFVLGSSALGLTLFVTRGWQKQVQSPDHNDT